MSPVIPAQKVSSVIQNALYTRFFHARLDLCCFIHMGIFFLSYPVQTCGNDKTNKQLHIERQVTSLSDQSDIIMLGHISAYSGTSDHTHLLFLSIFWYKNAVLNDEQAKC